MTERLILCLSALVVLGCGPGAGERPYIDHSRDPEALAVSVKYTVDIAVDDARTSDEPADAVSSVADFLEDLSRRPTGDHLSIYRQIAALANEIVEESEAVDGRPTNLDQRLDELEELAEQLPGDPSAIPGWDSQ